MSDLPDAWGTQLYVMLATASDQATRLHEAYERTGQLALLDQAITMFTEVLAVARNVDIRGAAANGLGTSLWSRYERFGNLTDLDNAIGLFREALAAYPNEQTDSTLSFRVNLSGTLRLRWQRTGSDADLAESVEQIRAVVAATPATDSRRPGRLNNAADSLLALYQRHHDSSALAEAVELFRQAVHTAGPNHDVAAYQSNLSEALRQSYRGTGQGDRSLLDQAVASAREAAAAPNHPLHTRFRSNLALALLERFESTRRPADLAEAADLAQQAVDATPADHPNRVERLMALSHLRRLEVTHAAGKPNRRAMKRMIESADDAAAAVPEGHVLHARSRLLQGSAWAYLAASGNPTAIDPAIAAFRTVALDPTAQPHARVGAARHWGAVSVVRTRAFDSAAVREPFELAVELLPRTAPRKITRADREFQLAAFPGLARDAAACAIAAGDAEQALRLLEHGRGVLLGHALDARTELTGLRRERPDLADRFEALRDALDRPEGTGFSSSAATDTLAGEDRHELARDWDLLVDRIRGLDGFEQFLRPPRVDELLAAAEPHGPVVVTNISALRCDALLLADGRLGTLPLRLDLAEVIEHAQRFRAATVRAEHPGLAGDVREEARRTVAETLEWLWYAVAAPVLDALAPATGTRLWWVPTGPMTTLPLHAAGLRGGPAVLDQVVSSYAPTVRGLVTAWQQRPVPRTDGPLVVALANTPGMPDLPSVPAEAAILSQRFPTSTMLTEERAVRQNVLDALPRHRMAHFCCHAVSAADGAPDGHLVLHDHASAPLTVADISRLHLEHAELAYLSACDTGVGPEELDDEALHVTGACQMAGFRHVIGTLWSVRDTLAPAVTAHFYTALGTPDDAAVALHDAVRNLRSAYPDSPTLWAPYVHVGP